MAITLQRIKQLEEESRLRNQTYKYLILPIFMVPFICLKAVAKSNSLNKFEKV